ncbi:Rieske 2Fe-2S domain-containing protein [Gordonia sp. PKS22-38]|uniref:Rieske 2Fe-2S domain-containing protein n=1 Tax=Gordonia prachuapensis TaxID=3115651 RepID=A0ABU7MUZ8_9ACTN|nr:Rieske 2Fe-2S domain-containing protein [Gordonia sp. PKS22-38]
MSSDSIELHRDAESFGDDWLPAATTKELRRRRKLRVELGDTPIALFSAGDRIYAFADLCVHQDRSLARGTIMAGRVICPGHQWQFDLETGYEADQDICQPTYDVRIDGETIYVNVAARAAAGAEARETS